MYVMTAGGRVYLIQFERCFLKQCETIAVKQIKIDLALRQESIVKCFEMTEVNGSDVFIVGTSEYVRGSDRRQEDT